MAEEKRLYQRLILNRPAKRDFDNSSPDRFATMVLDIGPEGIGFTVDEKLNIGKYVFLDIDLGNGERIELSVQILWVERIGDSEQFRVGGKIRDAKKEDLEKMVRFYCEQLIPVRDENKESPDLADQESDEGREKKA